MASDGRITQAQWEARGLDLFGDDKTRWVFQCPSCKNQLSAAVVREKFAEQLPALRAGKYAIEQECIGRHLPGVGCNWAAYGLFRGPVIVDTGDGKTTACFEFGSVPAPVQP